MKEKNKITDWVAIFIAFLAVCLSAWTGFEDRKHNHLSSRPYLSYMFNIPSRMDSVNKTEFSIDLSNEGLGPAIIDKIQFYIDDAPVKLENSNGERIISDPSGGWLTALDKLKIKNFVEQVTNIDNIVFSPGKTKRIFTISSKNLNYLNDDIDKFNKALSRFKFIVVYKSIYGEKFFLTVDISNYFKEKSLFLKRDLDVFTNTSP